MAKSKSSSKPDKNPGGTSSGSREKSASAAATASAAQKSFNNSISSGEGESRSRSSSRTTSISSGDGRSSSPSRPRSVPSGEGSTGGTRTVRTSTGAGSTGGTRAVSPKGGKDDAALVQQILTQRGIAGLPGLPGMPAAPTPPGGGALARDAMLGKRTFSQTPMYDAAGNVVGQYGGEGVSPGGVGMTPTTYIEDPNFFAMPGALPPPPAPPTYDPQRMMEVNQTPGVGLPFVDAALFAGADAEVLALPENRAVRAELATRELGNVGPVQGPLPPPPALAGDYDSQRMMEINRTPGVGLPFADPTLFADLDAEVLARPENREIRADLARAKEREAAAAQPAPQTIPPTVMDAQTAAWENAGLSDRIEQARIEEGLEPSTDLTPTASPRPVMAPQTTSMTTRPRMRPELMDYGGNVIPGGYAELRTTGVAPNRSPTTTGQFPVGQPVGEPYTMPPGPMLFDGSGPVGLPAAPQTTPVPRPQDPFEEGFLSALGPSTSPLPQARPETSGGAAPQNFTSEPVNLTNMRPIMNPSYGPNTPREEFVSPPATAPAATIPAPVPPGMGGPTPTPQPTTTFAPQPAAPAPTVPAPAMAPQNIAPAAQPLPAGVGIPGVGPVIGGIQNAVRGVSDVLTGGRPLFGEGGVFPANEGYRNEDGSFNFDEWAADNSEDKSDRDRDRAEATNPTEGLPGKGKGGDYVPPEQAPVNPPYIPPTGPVPPGVPVTPVTPTPYYRSYNDLMAAAQMGYPMAMAGGGMVKPGMTNAFVPGSYYASYDPRKRGLGGM